MNIKMIEEIEASCNASGNATKIYKKDEIIECKEKWQVELANSLVASGLAMECKTVAPKETKKADKKPSAPKVKRKKSVKKD
jgi:hypothetical protein|tara:strand:- start:1801 stop:2046 length:246 start_codon:yes stop_codon:yes gene_type:complete